MSETNGKTYNICLLGAVLDVGNLGCRALAVSLIGLALRCRDDAKIYLLYGNRTGGERALDIAGRKVTVQIVNYRLSPRSRVRDHLLWILLCAFLYWLLPISLVRKKLCQATPWLDVLSRADFVGDIYGGDSFSDTYGLRPLIWGILSDIIVILMGKDLVLLPQTVGPFQSFAARAMARWLLARAARVYGRDVESVSLARSLMRGGCDKGKAQFCPDVAFALDSEAPVDSKIVPPLKLDSVGLLVGINVSGLLYGSDFIRANKSMLRSGYKDLIVALIERIMTDTDAHVLLIPHTFGTSEEADQSACREVWQTVSESYGERAHLVTDTRHEREIKGIIGACDFFIGSRMHSCIAALSQRVPCVAIAYSRKFAGVFESAGVEDMVLDARDRTLEEIVVECVRRLREREKVAAVLGERAVGLKKRVMDCMRREFCRQAGPGSIQTDSAGRAY